MTCEEVKVKLTLERIYSSNPEEEEFVIYERNTNNVIYEEFYNGTVITENEVYVNSIVHRLVLTDSVGNGWSDGSKLIISSESGVLGEFTLSSGSSMEILIHPILGVVNETIITDCSGLETIPSNVTSLIIEFNACNSGNVTIFILTNYEYLESIEIEGSNLMHVNTFVIDGLNKLKSLKIGRYSFTKNYYEESDGSRSFHILNCCELESIEIGSSSFEDYGGGFELINLPKLSTIKIGEIGSWSANFYSSSFEIKGIMYLY